MFRISFEPGCAGDRATDRTLENGAAGRTRGPPGAVALAARP